MRFPYKAKDFKSVQKNFDYLIGILGGFTREVRGQAVAVGTGASFADAVVTDNFGTTTKRGVANLHSGGTYTADTVICNVTSTTDSTITFRVFSSAGVAGVIPVGQTVLIDYIAWR